VGFKQSRTETRPDRQLAVIISEELDERVHQLLDFRFVGAVFSRANTLAEAADHELSRGSFKCGARCAELLHDVMAIAPFVASAHRAQPERDMTGDGRGWGEPSSASRRSLIFSAECARSLLRCAIWSGRRSKRICRSLAWLPDALPSDREVSSADRRSSSLSGSVSITLVAYVPELLQA